MTTPTPNMAELAARLSGELDAIRDYLAVNVEEYEAQAVEHGSPVAGGMRNAYADALRVVDNALARIYPDPV